MKDEIMDWEKVIANLREQSNYYAKKANEVSFQAGQYDLVEEMRASSNIASILASALTAGLKEPLDKGRTITPNQPGS